MWNSRSNRMTIVARFSAMLAILVILTGRMLHLHQACSDCSDSACPGVFCGDVCDAAHAGCNPGEMLSACPYGFGHDGTGPSDQLPPGRKAGHPSHDSHQCSVCSVLAQAPCGVTLVELAQTCESAERTPDGQPESPSAGHRFSVQPRGPPFTA